MTTTAPVTTTPDRDGRLWWLVIVPLLGLILGALLLILVWSPGLPAEVATQWAWGEGTVTTVRPLWSSVLPMALIALGFLLGILILEGTGRLTSWGRRLNLGVLAGVTAMIAVAPVVLLAGQRGHDFAWDAPDPVGTVAGAAAVCVLYAAAVTLLVGNRPLSDAPPENAAATAVRMDLAEEEDAVWARTTTAWAFVLLGLAGLGVTITGTVVDGLWPLALLGSVLVLLGVGLSRWTVVVDRAGVCCTSLLGLARFSAPAVADAVADVTSVRGLAEFLGWGIRFGGAGSVGLVFRNGEALRVRAPGGRSLTVTVEDAATAAALFNTQAARRSS
jgi:hypothetical protein